MRDLHIAQTRFIVNSPNYDRLLKENGLYTKEIEELGIRQQKFIAENREEWDIKNVVRIPCNLEASHAIQIQTSRSAGKAH